MSSEKKFGRKISRVFDRHRKQKKEMLLLQNRLSKHDISGANRTVVFSYQVLKDALGRMTPEQLSQQVQILGPCSGVGDSVMLEPVFAAGTVEEMCHVDGVPEQRTHSAIDFKHHPEQFVLLSDYCGFGEDGDTMYTMDKDEDGETIMIGNVSGKSHHIIERRSCEPSIKASRMPAFQKQMAAPDEHLMQTQEHLARKSEKEPLTPEEQDTLNNIQAELYRRIYSLGAK